MKTYILIMVLFIASTAMAAEPEQPTRDQLLMLKGAHLQSIEQIKEQANRAIADINMRIKDVDEKIAQMDGPQAKAKTK